MRKRRRSRGAAGHILTLAALGVIALLWVRVLTVQPRAVEPPPPASAEQKEQARRKLGEITGAVGRIEAASRQGRVRKTTVRLSASDINALLAAEPEVRGALDAASVRDLQVRITDGKIITLASVEKAGVPVTVRAVGWLDAAGGLMVYDSNRVTVNGIPAPAPVRNALDLRVQEAFHQLQQKVQARVDRVVMKDDRIFLHLSSDLG